jgi:hypothetical protein
MFGILKVLQLGGAGGGMTVLSFDDDFNEGVLLFILCTDGERVTVLSFENDFNEGVTLFTLRTDGERVGVLPPSDSRLSTGLSLLSPGMVGGISGTWVLDLLRTESSLDSVACKDSSLMLGVELSSYKLTVLTLVVRLDGSGGYSVGGTSAVIYSVEGALLLGGHLQLLAVA